MCWSTIKSWFGKEISAARKYTWKPDLPDFRDFMFSGIKPPSKIPESVDLRPICPPVQDQGQLGSCTANALTGAVEILEGIDKLPPTLMSRLFVYYNERVIEKTVNQDSGAMIRDGIKTLNKQGCCPETDWPYNIAKFKSKPPTKAYSDAVAHKITSYYRINSIDDMRACLALGYPFVFGFTVYESFESAQTAVTGIVNMPQPGESVLGGHAVVCVGYDDATQRVIVRNSWGNVWGLKGYFLLPYAYISNKNLADDMWMIRRGTGM